MTGVFSFTHILSIIITWMFSSNKKKFSQLFILIENIVYLRQIQKIQFLAYLVAEQMMYKLGLK